MAIGNTLAMAPSGAASPANGAEPAERANERGGLEMKPSAVAERRPEGAGPGRARRGMSLVELLVVMAILGALLAFGVPAVAKMLRRMQCSATLSGISRVLTTARLAAIKGVSGAAVGTPPAPVVVLIEKGG